MTLLGLQLSENAGVMQPQRTAMASLGKKFCLLQSNSFSPDAEHAFVLFVIVRL